MINISIIASWVFCAAYFALEKYGLFGLHKEGIYAVLHAGPFAVGAAAALFLMLVKSLKRQGRRGLLIQISLLLMLSGVLLDYLTGFRGEATVIEGMDINQRTLQFLPGKVISGKIGHAPDIDMKLNVLDVRYSEDGRKIDGYSADFSYGVRELKSSDSIPMLFWGYTLRLKDIGYALRIMLKEEKGTLLNNEFLLLKLYPQGREDYFRFFSPLTFHIGLADDWNWRVKPDSYKVRVARNLDIVYSGDIVLKQPFNFENAVMSIEERKMWATLEITGGYGPGLLLFGLTLYAVHMARNTLRKN